MLESFADVMRHCSSSRSGMMFSVVGSDKSDLGMKQQHFQQRATTGHCSILLK
jgi:hypothetical protein